MYNVSACNPKIAPHLGEDSTRLLRELATRLRARCCLKSLPRTEDGVFSRDKLFFDERFEIIGIQKRIAALFLKLRQRFHQSRLGLGMLRIARQISPFIGIFCQIIEFVSRRPLPSLESSLDFRRDCFSLIWQDAGNHEVPVMFIEIGPGDEIFGAGTRAADQFVAGVADRLLDEAIPRTV